MINNWSVHPFQRCSIGFFHQLQGNVIYKPYGANAWANNDASTGKFSLSCPAQIYTEDLKNHATLQASPGIFQEKIGKDFEVRVTVMGKSCCAVKILSQEHNSTKNDWRQDYSNLKIERMVLPEKISNLCLDYMQRADLRFGCFDFIVTPDGEYFFLEINQMGQFLWQEDMQPDIPLLQMFCDFLISGNTGFTWQETVPTVTFSAYKASKAGRTFKESLRKQVA